MQTNIQKTQENDEIVTRNKMGIKCKKHHINAAKPLKAKRLRGVNSARGTFTTIFTETLAYPFFL